jgi:hypothetical protein
LTTPTEPALLASAEPYYFLAGRLITQQAVDAKDCPSGGLLVNGYANQCGLERALPVMQTWQNQFDPQIIQASLQADIPSQLLKNIFAQESQFWPGIFRDPKEFGLGQLTDNGAETLLLWNPDYFEQFCPQVLGEETCRLGYTNISETERKLLSGALAQEARADCPECPLGIDLEKTQRSVYLFAETLRANCSQVAQIMYNGTRKIAGEVSSYEDLWRLTVANYHIGAGCVSYAVYSAWERGGPMDWLTISQYFTPPCLGVIPYVEKITGIKSP